MIQIKRAIFELKGDSYRFEPKGLLFDFWGKVWKRVCCSVFD